MAKRKEYDVFIIGTGTAGKSVAKDCAAKGLKVAIADNRAYGGTCSQRGCDPKKVLLGITEILERADKMIGKGIVKLPEVNWADLMNFKESFVDAVPAATEKDLKKSGIELYHQSPKFLDTNTLSVEGKTMSAKKIVIATGQKARGLDIPGWEHAHVSEDFLNLKELPASMLIIGCGYIGMEFAHIAARMGVKVSMMDMAPRPLTNFDEDMVGYLQTASEALGITFIFDAKVNKIDKLRKNFRVTAEKDGKEISATAEWILNTSGRVPSIADLDLKEGDVKYCEKGIIVNDHLQSTSNKNVYACGDVAWSDGLPLTPLSSVEAKIVSHNILNDQDLKRTQYPPQPSVVFTLPPLAAVGLSEEQARANDIDFTVEHKLVPQWFNAKRINEPLYAYKTLVDNTSGQIIGAHLVGPEAAEIINLFAMAMYGKIDHQAVKNMIFAYPTWGSDIKGML